jgi:polyferredoxin
MSPVLLVYAASKGILNGSFFIFILMFMASLFLGRAFCGWLCPGGGIQELLSMVIKRKTHRTKAIYIKFYISGIWLSVVAILYFIYGWQVIDLGFGMDNITSMRKLIMGAGVITIMLPLALFFGKWASCRYICWLAPIMIFGKFIQRKLRIPSLKIKADSSKCNQCKACNSKCPLGIDVANAVKTGHITDFDCVMCGNCVDGCKKGVLKFRMN